MNRFSRLPRWQALLAGVLLAAPGMAQQIGSSNTATADPPVPRPGTTPCVVQLYSGLTFADFSPKPFAYTPPAACPAPWSKVVLEADFSVTAGRQFDRTAQIALGHVNIYFGTTMEPSASVSPSWHVERDLTDYSPLFRTAQAGDVNLGNLVNSTYTGIIHGSARVLLYPASAAVPAPRTADAVLPLSDASGGRGPAGHDVERAGADLLAAGQRRGGLSGRFPQSQSSDEFWFTCVPDDVSDELFSCPGTSFREAEVTIDGQPAGVAPVYPWMFTGAIDPLALASDPQRSDAELPPLSRRSHAVRGGAQRRPAAPGGGQRLQRQQLLHGGGVAAALSRSRREPGDGRRHPQHARRRPARHHPRGPRDGGRTARSAARCRRPPSGDSRIAGYVNTSHGRVQTTVRQTLSFSNRQRFLISATDYIQKIRQGTEIVSAVDTTGPHAVAHSDQHFSFPLALDYTFLGNADGSGSQTTSFDQKFESQEARVGAAAPPSPPSPTP